MRMTQTAPFRLLAVAALLALLAAAYWLLHETGALSIILDGEALRDHIARLGAWGPLAVMGLMMLAILLSPIPSAPIAMAAGAAYGHIWGTIYVLVGAEIGAITAFGIARWLGAATLRRWFGDRLKVGLMGSQNALTGIVLISRLLPFISFDIISYAAGLTVLSFWRFALATLVGIAPTSFLLAHFGGEMLTGESDRIFISVLALGGITLIPVAVKLIRDHLRRPQKYQRNNLLMMVAIVPMAGAGFFGAVPGGVHAAQQNPGSGLRHAHTWAGDARDHAIRNLRTAASFQVRPLPGRSGMTACPSTMRSGSSTTALIQSTYSSQCAVGVAASRCALTSG